MQRTTDFRFFSSVRSLVEKRSCSARPIARQPLRKMLTFSIFLLTCVGLRLYVGTASACSLRRSLVEGGKGA